uniref:Uncharacterized protein n=1 Tax=Trypanosoma congolense (strain IL3000) TaxID=1068625 RepID=G0UVH0_TRYCI|nr:conserved hypothetical protein [Trypanosoma congolense IL3000]
MSVVASFVAECARSGRWVRGILSLRSSNYEADTSMDMARIQLASATLDKQWIFALRLIKVSDFLYDDDTIDSFVHRSSKCSHIPAEVFNSLIVKSLKLTTSDTKRQNRLFVSAVKWASWVQATHFFSFLSHPQRRSVTELVNLLKDAHTSGNRSTQRHIGLVIDNVNKMYIGNASDGKRCDRPRICTGMVQVPSKTPVQLVRILNIMGTGGEISVLEIMNLAKAAMRGEECSWKLPLSLLSGCRLVDGSSTVLAKMIGTCCAYNWRHALCHLNVNGGLGLWLASRHSWEAGLVVSQSADISARKKHDILSRCTTPLSQLRRVMKIHRASKRLDSTSKASIAALLANGYIIEELQLSAFARACQRVGDWESSIYLFERISNEEFQRRAIQCILMHRKEIKVVRLLQLISERNPASTSTASALIKHSDDWVEALWVLRHVIAQGTQCNPQILSAFMDVQPPNNIISDVLRQLRLVACNDGIFRRYKQLEVEKGHTAH